MATDAPNGNGAQRPHSHNGSRNSYGSTMTNEDKLARFLGWFSISLGVAQTLAPGAVGRLVGARDSRSLIRMFGLREIASGVGILTQPKPSNWLWSRVGGDVVDLLSLAAALNSDGAERGKTISAIAAVSGMTALDVLCARQHSEQEVDAPDVATDRAETSLIVNRSPEDCYGFWRDFENMPRFMDYLKSVRVTGDRHSHWIARTPGNVSDVEWDAEMTEDIPNERISWKSLPGADVYNSGSVTFERSAAGRGTVIRVQLDFSLPGQHVTSTLAHLIGKHPQDMINKDLRRFKQILETGEAITTEGQSAGRRSSTTWLDAFAR